MIHLYVGLNSFIALITRNKKLISVLFFILFIFATLRYDFGNDFNSYLNWFNYIKETNKNPFGSQVLFTLLNKISPNFTFLLVITSGFYLLAVYKLIKNYVSDEFCGVSFFIFLINPYLFFMNLSAIRQSIAIAIFIYATEFSKKNKLVPYIILVFIATLFHKSAIILFPFYFFANERKVKRWQIIGLVVITLFFLLIPQKLNELIEVFLNYFNDSTYNSYYSSAVGNSLRATILSSIYFIYLLLNIEKLNGNALLYSKLYLIALIFAILSYNFSMATRLQMFFDIFSVVSIPSIIESNVKYSKNSADKIINTYIFPTLIFLIYILRYYSFFTNDLWEKFASYQTILGVNK